MNIITNKTRNYLPNSFETKLHAVKRSLESGWKTNKVCNYYHVKRQSLSRWIRQVKASNFDYNILYDRSHRPLSKHQNSLTSDEIHNILLLSQRNPQETYLEIYVKLKVNYDFTRSHRSVLRTLQRNNAKIEYKTNKKKKHNGIYHTPNMVGEKWQIDVKFVPKECVSIPDDDNKYYQYTVLDECSRKRFLYFCREHSMYETVKALKFAIKFFDYKPKILQSDNGFEFTDKARRYYNKNNPSSNNNYLESYLKTQGIEHKLIRPRTPEHNGKVERSHRIDQEKFYRYLKFYSFEDLCKQGAARNKKYNNIPKFVLNIKSPNQVELDKLKELLHDTGEIRCAKRLTSFVS